MSWEPILLGADAERARAAVHDIARALRRPLTPFDGRDENRTPLWNDPEWDRFLLLSVRHPGSAPLRPPSPRLAEALEADASEEAG